MTTMKKYNKYLLALTLALSLTSCEKDIPMDYHEVNSLYVAEGTTTQKGTQVQVSTTQNVTDNSRSGHYVDNAKVVITIKKYDYSEELKYTRNGIYTSTLKGEPGITYDLDIYVDDKHFSSSSTMQEEPVMNSFRFVWKKVLSTRYLFGELKIQDTPDKNSYYFAHIYRNNVGYRWAVIKDEHNRNGELLQLFQCCSEKDMDKGDSEALSDGDNIRLELRSIDKLSYDYLYSMQVMDNAGTNPIANFTGGCLGYFSACHVLSYNYKFIRSEVVEE